MQKEEERGKEWPNISGSPGKPVTCCSPKVYVNGDRPDISGDLRIPEVAHPHPRREGTERCGLEAECVGNSSGTDTMGTAVYFLTSLATFMNLSNTVIKASPRRPSNS